RGGSRCVRREHRRLCVGHSAQGPQCGARRHRSGRCGRNAGNGQLKRFDRGSQSWVRPGGTADRQAKDLIMAELEAKGRELVSTKELQNTVTYLCGLGEKVSASDEERKACDYLTSRLRAYGYTPVVHEFDSYISYPRSANFIISTARERFDIPAVGVAFGQSTAPDGITEDVVLVGSGSEAEYADKDVRGRIVLVTKLPSPANALSAARHGARGMICMSAGKQRHKMIITPVWGTPEFEQASSIPRLHVVSIAKTDGDRIVAALNEGPVRATLAADTFEGWRKV